MQSLRLANARAARAVVVPQRRLLATPPTGIPPVPPPPSGAAPVRPVVVVNTPPVTPGSSTLPADAIIPPSASGTLPPPPPPPPPPPRKPRHFFRRLLLYSSLGILTFYPLSGFLSTKSETYRDFFTATFPFGEAVADYADDRAWESFGVGTVSQKAVEGWQKMTGDATPQAPGQKVEAKAKEAQLDARAKAAQAKRDAEAKAAQLKKDTEAKAAQVKKDAEAKAAQAKKEVEAAAEKAKAKGKEVASAAQKKAEEAKASAKSAAEKAQAEAASLKDRVVAATQDAADKAKALARDAKDKVAQATAAVPFNAGEGVESIVREAERALHKGEEKVADAAQTAKDALTPTGGPRVLPDTQRPRELRPETVTPAKPTFEGQEKYAGPPLPLGFEPPPGYYIPPAKAAAASAAPAAPVLPLLAPKVKDFGTDEPIISQLASTIDSLTSSLSTPGSGPSTNASGILSKAQDDLTALSSRLAEIKKAEKAKLEKSLSDKAKEFEATLRNVEASKAQSEAGIREQWQKERNTMVEGWKKDMDKELESQREGIEKRLHEEVISQGIELQRRWLRSIKAQVESERGGRLAKLDNLTTSLKQLERITLDNSATLDDNVRVHKIWSALRAVQSKADSGDVAFTEELRVLKSLAAQDETPTVVSSALKSLETSGVAQTGVKSLAALSSWFTTSVSPRVHSAGLTPAPETAGVASHLSSMALSKLMFRPQPGPVQGSDVSAVLARAEWCLAEKDLDGAAREVNALTGWPGLLAKDWLREARRALEVRQALEVVATEATLGSLLLV